jgi:CubicO group peptidase (beta-lactamase class C family)
MKKYRKWILAGTGAALLGFVAVVVYYAWALASIGAAYKAKVLCSGVFVAGRAPQSLLGVNLMVDDLLVLRHIDVQLDDNSKSVTADFLGILKRKAVYRPGLGCTLVYGAREDRFKDITAGSTATPQVRRDPRPWPIGDSGVIRPVPRELNKARLDAAVDWAFSEPDPKRPRRTRAVVVVYKGHIVAERYAPGFSKDTSLLGWSMTKSVINALAGILAKEGRLSLNGPVSVPEWQKPGDPRGRITLDHLLHMSSGLRFDEDYRNPLKDVTYMLLGVPDMAAYAAQKPLAAEPGTRWSYASGTTNIIARLLRDIVGEADYPLFPRRALFDRIGMHSAVIEMDASGTFVGSAFMYATARDWARFGLLYLRDGIWRGERILPEGWVQYARTPAPAAPSREYGAHFWLRIPAEYRSGRNRSAPPGDAFHAVGHEGQFVTIIPSRDLVIVRFGLTRQANAWAHDTFIGLVLDAMQR